MNWKIAKDSKAPQGWTNLGLTGKVDDSEVDCANGWHGFARNKAQGQLYATMKGSGRATVKYKDCLGQGFATLYLNGKQLDKSETNSGKLRMFRSLQCAGYKFSYLIANI